MDLTPPNGDIFLTKLFWGSFVWPNKVEDVFTVPAGEYELEVYNGEKKGASRITLPAGQAVEATLQLR